MDDVIFIGLSLLFFVAVLSVPYYFSIARPRNLAKAADVCISRKYLVGMNMRRVSVMCVIRPLVTAAKAGLDIDIKQLEAHYLVGGNAEHVVDALIAARSAGEKMGFEQAAALDLAGQIKHRKK